MTIGDTVHFKSRLKLHKFDSVTGLLRCSVNGINFNLPPVMLDLECKVVYVVPKMDIKEDPDTGIHYAKKIVKDGVTHLCKALIDNEYFSTGILHWKSIKSSNSNMLDLKKAQTIEITHGPFKYELTKDSQSLYIRYLNSVALMPDTVFEVQRFRVFKKQKSNAYSDYRSVKWDVDTTNGIKYVKYESILVHVVEIFRDVEWILPYESLKSNLST